MANNSLKRYMAEFAGTAILTFMGCGSAVFLGSATTSGHLAVAFSFGISVIAMAFVIGRVSGCHINPAVSLALFLDKRMSKEDLYGYIFAQLAGGICGALLLSMVSTIAGIDHTGILGSNIAAGAGGPGGAFFIELILTFIFLLTILSVTDCTSDKTFAGILIGLFLTFIHIVGIPLTGTSVNPARSLGPALFAGGQALRDLWIFILAPFSGAVLAVFVFNALKENLKSKEYTSEQPGSIF